jgi:hypothetical protein
MVLLDREDHIPDSRLKIGLRLMSVTAATWFYFGVRIVLYGSPVGKLVPNSLGLLVFASEFFGMPFRVFYSSVENKKSSRFAGPALLID